MSVRSTVICDGCGQHFLLDDEELPPYWFAVQIVVADGDGVIPAFERETFAHFCSQDCVVEYCKGDTLREFAALADSEALEDLDEEEEEEESDDAQ